MIPQLEKWITRLHGQTNYHATQVLAGYGNCYEYLYNVNRINGPYCGLSNRNAIETVKHTVLKMIDLTTSDITQYSIQKKIHTK